MGTFDLSTPRMRTTVITCLFLAAVAATAHAGYSKVVQVTCPEGCSTCMCSGCKNLTFPLGKCVSAGDGANATQLAARPFDDTPNGYFVKPSCKSNGKTFIEMIYLNSKCSGDAFSKTTINTDACVRTAGG